MRILDLFSGLGGQLRRPTIEELGHEYTTLDNNPNFASDITADIFSWEPVGEYDFIWASPPCQGFSIASVSHHWSKAGVPKTEAAITSLRLILRTLMIIEIIDPYAWVIENPRGMLRKQGIMNRYRRYTVTYCQYGDTSMKPTDLWGVLSGWEPRPMCKNGDPCHEAAPRGSKLGTQGKKTAAERAIVPLELWIEILSHISKTYDTMKI